MNSSDEDKKIVADTNIILDFKRGEILFSLEILPSKIMISHSVYSDELKHEHIDLQNLIQSEKIKIVQRNKATDEIYDSLRQFKTKSTGRYDLLNLTLAIYFACTLATGDEKLKRLAHRKNVPTTGTIGMAEDIVKSGFSVDEMLVAFEKMKAADSIMSG